MAREIFCTDRHTFVTQRAMSRLPDFTHIIFGNLRAIPFPPPPIVSSLGYGSIFHISGTRRQLVHANSRMLPQWGSTSSILDRKPVGTGSVMSR